MAAEAWGRGWHRWWELPGRGVSRVTKTWVWPWALPEEAVQPWGGGEHRHRSGQQPRDPEPGHRCEACLRLRESAAGACGPGGMVGGVPGVSRGHSCLRRLLCLKGDTRAFPEHVARLAAEPLWHRQALGTGQARAAPPPLLPSLCLLPEVLGEDL